MRGHSLPAMPDVPITAPVSFKIDSVDAILRMRVDASAPLSSAKEPGTHHASVTLRQMAGGLTLVCQIARYDRYGASEWSLRMRNDGDAPSGIVSDLLSADVALPIAGPGEAVTLFSSEGSHERLTDFRPSSRRLAAGKEETLESFGGRSSDGALPFFNVFGPGGGCIVGVGWTGDWRASVSLNSDGSVRVKVGLQRAHFRLLPGEEVRLPGVLLMPWTGKEMMDGQNQFRRLLFDHFTPRGQPWQKLMPVAVSPHGVVAFNDVTEANLLDFAKRIKESKLPFDTLWLDAGWTGRIRAMDRQSAARPRPPAARARAIG